MRAVRGVPEILGRLYIFARLEMEIFSDRMQTRSLSPKENQRALLSARGPLLLCFYSAMCDCVALCFLLCAVVSGEPTQILFARGYLVSFISWNASSFWRFSFAAVSLVGYRA